MKTIILLSALLLNGCAYQVKSGERVPAPFREQFGHIPAQVVKDAVTRAHGLFEYESDSKAGEWTSFGSELLMGVSFEGDCEDFAISVADYLTALGYERRHMALARANVGWIPKRGSYNHAVLIVSTESGQIVADNNYKRARRINFYNTDVWHSMRRLDSDNWHKINIMEAR